MTQEHSQTVPVTINIFGREYTIKCPEPEQQTLRRSAEHLSNRMQAIYDSGKTRSSDHIALMAALNITRDLFALQESTQQQTDHNTQDDELQQRLGKLQAEIDAALNTHSKT